MIAKNNLIIIAIVGPCGAGKTTLRDNLLKMGIVSRPITQEHSYVKDMWQRMTNPDILIFLDASYSETTKRKRLDWTVDEYYEQQRRLEHARIYADFYLFTDTITPIEVANRVFTFLMLRGIKPAESPTHS